jgi:hypothetical protein
LSSESLLLALAGATLLLDTTLDGGWSRGAGCRMTSSISKTPAAKASRAVNTVRMRAAQSWMASKLA